MSLYHRDKSPKMIDVQGERPISQNDDAKPLLEYCQYLKLKGCTKTTFDPLRAASNLGAKASCAR